MSPEHDAQAGGRRMRLDDPLNRRQLLKVLGGAGLSVGAGSLLAACGGGTSPAGTTPGATGATGTPKRGGHITMGLGGGGNTDVADPGLPGAQVTTCANNSVWEQLTQIDGDFKFGNVLAESVESNKDATEWTIRLKPGIEFHNGKTVGADDVIFTFNRILDPKNGLVGQLQVGPIDSMRKLDARTVRVKMKQPYSVFNVAIGDGSVCGIVPEGFSRSHPIGTGPFKMTKFVPGRIIELERFPNYWGDHNQPYLDGITIQVINDDSARMNAFLTGQVDVVNLVPSAQIPLIEKNNNLKLLISKNSFANYYGMNVEHAPFNDVRVRQALKLSLDRDQIVKNALAGYGSAGSDVFSPYDPASDRALVRKQDVEQAKALLKQAGYNGAPVQLTVSQLSTGVVEAATVMAQQAGAVGLKIKVNQVDSGTLLGANALKWPFSVNGLPGLSYPTSASLANVKGAPLNIGHWADPRYTSLYDQAVATTDKAKRVELIREMQKLEFDEGPNLIPFFGNSVDAYSAKISGWPKQDLTGEGLGRGMWGGLYRV
jgi:peptide/nickel transport system substrate-binding protein